MPLEITQREMNGIYLLALKRASGAWTREQRVAYHGRQSPRIRRHTIVINLQQVNYVDSAGLEHSSKCSKRQKPKAEASSFVISARI